MVVMAGTVMCVVADAVAYSFGRLGGLVDVRFGEQERANTRRDRVVVGFRTTTTTSEERRAATGVAARPPPSRVLLRVASATSNDFVQLSLVGQLLASTVSAPFTKVRAPGL